MAPGSRGDPRQMFNIPWVHLYWPIAPIQVGTEVAVSVHHFGFHSLNACRIVYVVDEDGTIKRLGFAYGTLWEHAESGEERFGDATKTRSGTTSSPFLGHGRWRPDWHTRFRGNFSGILRRLRSWRCFVLQTPPEQFPPRSPN